MVRLVYFKIQLQLWKKQVCKINFSGVTFLSNTLLANELKVRVIQLVKNAVDNVVFPALMGVF
ncbi:hypothetical protein D0Z62_06405 [Providencia rettgeri]|nr:hypothetical protein D0Z62_06405 [Providencia rettgeri]